MAASASIPRPSRVLLHCRQGCGAPCQGPSAAPEAGSLGAREDPAGACGWLPFPAARGTCGWLPSWGGEFSAPENLQGRRGRTRFSEGPPPSRLASRVGDVAPTSELRPRRSGREPGQGPHLLPPPPGALSPARCVCTVYALLGQNVLFWG